VFSAEMLDLQSSTVARKNKLDLRCQFQNQEAFGDAIRAGNLKAVKEMLNKHWPECLSYTFSYNIHFRRTEQEPTKKPEDAVDGGKVGSSMATVQLQVT